MMNKGRIISFFMACVLCIGLAVPAFAAKQEPIVSIDSTEDFLEFVKNCTLDTWSQGKEFRLTSDLNLEGTDFVSIPTFGGTFNGQDHTIKGWSVSGGVSNVGFFGIVQTGAVVKNLQVTGSIVSAGTQDVLGGIAGTNNGVIRDCSFNGTIKGNSMVGGIVGSNEASGVITGCRASGIVSGTHFTGGIVGLNSGSVLNSTNESAVNTDYVEPPVSIEDVEIDWERLNSTENTPAHTDTGGISGYSTGSIELCTNSGSVGYPHVGYNVGGIAGRQSGCLSGCVNKGIINGRKDVGGIVGQMAPDISLKFSETGIQKLEAELNTLHQLLNKTLDNADAASANVSAELTTASGYLDTARDSAGSMNSKMTYFANSNIDSANEMTSLAQKYTARLPEILSQFGAAAEDISQAAADLQQAAQRLESLGDVGTSGLTDELAQLQEDSAELSSAMMKLSEIVNEALVEYQETGRISSATLGRLLQSLSETTACASDVKTDVNDIMQKIEWEQIGEEASEIAVQMRDAASKLESAPRSLSSAVSQLEKWTTDLAGEDEIEFSNLGSDYTRSSERLNASLTGLSSSLTSLNGTLSSSSDTLIGDLRAVNNQFMVVMNLMMDVYTDVSTADLDRESYYEDISDEDIYETREGKVVGCKNTGTVDGDVNVGGVAGSMAIEYDLDPEDDISTDGNRSYDFKYQTRAIALECVNTGSVTSKKDCAGGMVGRMDLGTVYASENYGFISSTDGDYVGGIAGQSLSSIRKSFAKSFLSGRRYVGGIAGEGKDISGCYTMVKVRGDSQNAAAIAGGVTGTLSDNYFVSDDLAGVDRVSLSGKAEPASYEALLLAEGIPVQFKSLSMIFMADDEVVKTLSAQYGKTLGQSNVPNVPYKEGCYGQWSTTDFTNLRFDDMVEAVYTRYYTTLASSVLRSNGQSVILVDGQFSQDEAITVTKGEVLDIPLDGIDEYWCISVPEDGAEQHTIRFQPLNGNPEKTTIYLYADGQWSKADTEVMGSYLLLSAEGAEMQLAIDSAEQSRMLLIAVSTGVALLTLTIIVLRRRTKVKT